jgi:hypothetical protein
MGYMMHVSEFLLWILVVVFAWVASYNMGVCQSEVEAVA